MNVLSASSIYCHLVDFAIMHQTNHWESGLRKLNQCIHLLALTLLQTISHAMFEFSDHNYHPSHNQSEHYTEYTQNYCKYILIITYLHHLCHKQSTRVYNPASCIIKNHSPSTNKAIMSSVLMTCEKPVSRLLTWFEQYNRMRVCLSLT